MMLPPDIASMRGAALLDAVSTFLKEQAEYYAGQPGSEGADQWARLYLGLALAMRALKGQQEAHIARMAEKRARGERVYSETDQTVDLAVGAIRSPFQHVRRKPEQAA